MDDTAVGNGLNISEQCRESTAPIWCGCWWMIGARVIQILVCQMKYLLPEEPGGGTGETLACQPFLD